MFDLDEHALIRRTRQGDTEAFTPLVEKYHPRLYTHIHRRVKDAEIAKDLTQETWLKVLRSIQSYRGTAALSSWLYRIAENVCMDYFRKQKARGDIQPLDDIEEHHIRETSPCPSQEVLRQELHVHLKNALDYLTQSRREVFVLYYLHDLPIKAIAGRLKRSEGTIKTHLRNARLHLQESLTPYLKN